MTTPLRDRARGGAAWVAGAGLGALVVISGCSTPTPGPARPTDGCGTAISASSQTPYATPDEAAKAFVDRSVAEYRNRPPRHATSTGPVVGDQGEATAASPTVADPGSAGAPEATVDDPNADAASSVEDSGGGTDPLGSDGAASTANPALPTTPDRPGLPSGIDLGSVATSAAEVMASREDALMGILQRSIADQELVVRGQVDQVEIYAADERDYGSLFATQTASGWVITGTSYPCEGATPDPDD